MLLRPKNIYPDSNSVLWGGFFPPYGKFEASQKEERIMNSYVTIIQLQQWSNFITLLSVVTAHFFSLEFFPLYLKPILKIMFLDQK